MHEDNDSSPPGTWFAVGPRSWSRGQGIAVLVAIILLVLAGVWTLRPFLPALGWGSIFAISLWPLYERSVERWPRGEKVLLPAGFTLLILLVFVIPLVMVAAALVHDSVALAQWLATAREQGVPAPDFLQHLPYSDQLMNWWQSALATPAAIDRLAHHATGLPIGRGSKILTGLAHRFLLLSFMLVTLFFLLRDGQYVAKSVRIGSRRAFGEAGERVIRQATQAIRGTVNGLVIVGFGEGVLLGITYGLAGASHAALLGLVTGLLSAIPFGATVALIAAVALLAASGSIAAAVAVAVIGGVVVFVADHFVRPAFIGGSTRLPFLWVLLGILGGVETWGLIGLVMGPAVMAVLMLLWREWVGAVKGPLNPEANTETPVTGE
ncbi:AI-2E family transporter [Novosphingobium rosa]|uniref:AI-2E family transporter n=1 Tax=Novosphingobium rosa TaxID=76978 RepID=UPI0008311496|nr:AI-2E family transporter [Novosphingobium rosa]